MAQQLQRDTNTVPTGATPQPGAQRGGFLSVSNLVKRFGSHTALSDVSLDIRAGELVCLLGPSGCGKTTLLRAIAGLERQDSGTILLSGRDISHAEPQERDYGILFQSYALFPNLTVAQNVAYGLSGKRAHRKHVADRVEEMLTLVGLAGASHKYPGQISGGQQQRVALARALAPSPSLLLLDEPMSALDARVREHLRIELRALQKRLSITTLMVTHDQEEAMVMADRIAVMNGGVIEQFGTPRELYREPGSAFIADFVGEANWLPFERIDAHHARVGRQELAVDEALERNVGKLFVRPEAVRVSVARPEQPNTMLADVLDGVFLGRGYRLALRLEGVPGATVHSIVSPETGDALLGPHAASRCWVELPRHAIRAYA
ncbi:putative 2-aminoethylphosphonate ABC transporter ATP-binding protein [Achromobacter ruhlandii]|uniref:putative 2-aminoethylphosphonate ABC transporter ATP-binding protein n=1 Tax=Achromobacter ruhlandii TaxID=72557 RepID=UPI0006C27516|nr:putative 2-aminoethylphosphonate ABC transporter ATP-binding protein [Achromobacter ruhlandii]AMG47559.2 putative 2-aminoethylphosphonate ABC transporter ATP-binding protein [Achromobacter xylosoxidans]CUJ61385.1 Spermidine/putrescine import ATP-binding protein PotA [Achromobacter ruhlandii]CUJ69943.1 Spermidine/putrescine import ATP-binding protein PotA [Achromobacter ruhlandii]CUK23169.1 Spermidine/putrescine import ATP-binding protein PotA [Achromobacter ruhlandii]